MQPKTHWELDREALNRLLSALDADPAAAAIRYEELRRRLIKFFEWEKSEIPDRDADEALNRVARRLVEGTEIKAVFSFAMGVARFVLREQQAQTLRRDRAIEEFTANVRSTESTRDSKLLSCFERCMSRLPEQSRMLLRQYYGGMEAERIASRRTMAIELGVEQNALRNRVFRIREKLMACTLRCARSNFVANKPSDSVTLIREDS